MFQFVSKLRSQLFFDRYSLVQFFRQMSAMVNAGFGTLRALQTCHRQTSEQKLIYTLEYLAIRIEEGLSFSEALAETEDIFSSFHINMLRAAEISGNLPEILESLAQYEEKEIRLKRQVQAATIYPIFVCVVTFAAVLILMKFLLPLLDTVSGILKEEMPLPTVILMKVALALTNPVFYIALLILAIAFYFIYKYYIKTRGGKYFLDKLKFSIPLYKQLYKKVLFIRLARIFNILLKAGVPAVKSMEVIGQVSDNFFFKERIMDEITYRVSEGVAVATAFEDTKFFPVLMVSMLHIGEKSGTLPNILKKLADIYEFDVEMATNSFYSTLEPFLIIFLGGVTFFILLSAFLPLYKIIGAMAG